MNSELVSCSCEALDWTLLPVAVEVKYIVNNKERYAQRPASAVAFFFSLARSGNNPHRSPSRPPRSGGRDLLLKLNPSDNQGIRYRMNRQN